MACVYTAIPKPLKIKIADRTIPATKRNEKLLIEKLSADGPI